MSPTGYINIYKHQAQVKTLYVIKACIHTLNILLLSVSDVYYSVCETLGSSCWSQAPSGFFEVPQKWSEVKWLEPLWIFHVQIITASKEHCHSSCHWRQLVELRSFQKWEAAVFTLPYPIPEKTRKWKNLEEGLLSVLCKIVQKSAWNYAKV